MNPWLREKGFKSLGIVKDLTQEKESIRERARKNWVTSGPKAHAAQVAKRTRRKKLKELYGGALRKAMET